jgi:hypothetical protein
LELAKNKTENKENEVLKGEEEENHLSPPGHRKMLS